MKYITLINDFWRFYDENKNKLNTSDITLYLVILRYCNKQGLLKGNKELLKYQARLN